MDLIETSTRVHGVVTADREEFSYLSDKDYSMKYWWEMQVDQKEVALYRAGG